MQTLKIIIAFELGYSFRIVIVYYVVLKTVITSHLNLAAKMFIYCCKTRKVYLHRHARQPSPSVESSYNCVVLYLLKSWQTQMLNHPASNLQTTTLHKTF